MESPLAVLCAQRVYFTIIEQQNEMDRVIKTDLYRYGGLTGVKGFLTGWFIPGFRYTYFLRKSAKHRKLSFLGILYRLMLRRYRFKYGFEIDPRAQIGEGFYLSTHCGPVIIGPARIGKNCNIAHSVTIGRGISGARKGRPTIEDYVWIGTGSVIVGKVNIGRNVLIAPNSFVNFDVPPNSLVIGNPGQIIARENPTKDYINSTLTE